MSTRMLIDARHPEETRVTIVKGSRVEEFDYESASRRQLKGNIYLARVTRVEPSLQAAFVEYGGNRHGFLAFSEIHPDYYQIPVEDRDALIAAETEEAKSKQQENDAAEAEQPKPRRRRGRKSAAEKAAESEAVVSEVAEGDSELPSPDESATPNGEDSVDADVKVSDEDDKDAEIEEAANRRRGLKVLKRKYSIQEVIKRRQVLLIQVVKEERGNKGAALTTYLSLAGRYCVLMPNSTHAGGISRKISNISDRKKLKQIISSLEVSDDMGLIVRTAGLQRTKVEIKRDYDYLLRLWNGIRQLTLKSTAPALVYEEGNLIKRTIRDQYVREVDEILVEGEEGYRSAKDFMKLLMPSHAKKVQHYRDPIPLYHRYQVENHLEAMYQPIVQLKSGGYIVINPTEALISIDVNSGRATKEHNIEETAVKTNLEAAEEVARQLRLRDMAGLVVIDFIDMEDRSNNRSVERKMKDMLKNDRARIQVGRISSFGLMEMSRQRLRPNLLEVSMETCKTCAGSGIVRSVESASIMALRQLEEEGIRGRSTIVRIAANPDVAIYLLNKKRPALSELEGRYGYVIEVLAQPTLGQSDIEITRETGVVDVKPLPVSEAAVTLESSAPIHTAEVEEEKEEASEDDQQPRKKRRRRRRRRRGGNEDGSKETQGIASEATQQETDSDDSDNEAKQEAPTEDSDGKPNRRRRGTRGGRRRRGRNENEEANLATVSDEEQAEPKQEPDTEKSATEAPTPEEKPVRRRRRVKKTNTDEQKPTASENIAESNDSSATVEDASSSTGEKPKRRPRRRTSAKQAGSEAAKPTEAEGTSPAIEVEEKPKPRRRRAATKAPADMADGADSVSKPKRTPRRKAETKEDTGEQKKPARPRRTARPKAEASKSDKPVVAENTNAPQAKLVESGGDDQPKRKGWWQRTFG